MSARALFAVAVLLACSATLASAGTVLSPATDVGYLAQRKALLADASALRYNGDSGRLTTAESAVDAILDRLVAEEAARPSFLPNANFMAVKEQIDATPLYRLMATMPKGSVLHLHSTASVDFRWLMDSFLFGEKCYAKYDKDTKTFTAIRFFASAPADKEFTRMVDLRDSYHGTAEEFEQTLYDNLTITKLLTGDITEVWTHFQSGFSITWGVFGYKPVFEAYIARLCEILEKDGLTYAEIRHVPGALYDDDQTYTIAEELALFRDVVDKYHAAHPNFRMRVIYCQSRTQDTAALAKSLDGFLELRRTLGDFVVAFDLVGQEDKGHTSFYHVDTFLNARKKAAKMGMELPLILHDGETTDADNLNVYDALLLGSRRIGHGYALGREPSLWPHVKSKDVAIELSLVSNQVLKLVDDIRNHPGLALFAAGIRITLSSDDPSAFGYEGVSHDWYLAVAAWKLNVRDVKKIVFNSVEASTGMGKEERRAAVARMEKEWTMWTEHVAAHFDA